MDHSRLPEVICRTYREDVRSETGACKVEPLLIFPVRADIEVRLYFVIGAYTDTDEIVCKIRSKSIRVDGEVKDATPVEDLAVRNEPAVSAKVTTADLVGFLVEIILIFNEMKLSGQANVREKIKVEVGSTTVKSISIVGIGG